jgi:hypothetical protein
MSSTRQILAAIPCFNERVAIGSVALLARAHVDAVLVIDDGSSDRTADVAGQADCGCASSGLAFGAIVAEAMGTLEHFFFSHAEEIRYSRSR